MTTVAFIDARAGCAGDMFLGALIDLGWPLEALQRVVGALGLDFLGDLRATHQRHHQIQQGQIDIIGVGRKQLQRFLTVLSHQNLVTRPR